MLDIWLFVVSKIGNVGMNMIKKTRVTKQKGVKER